jgi:hypothetical protein
VCSSLGTYLGMLELEKTVLYRKSVFQENSRRCKYTHIILEPPDKFRNLKYISVYSTHASLSEIIMFLFGNFPKNLELFSSPVCVYEDFISQ